MLPSYLKKNDKCILKILFLAKDITLIHSEGEFGVETLFKYSNL